MACLIVGVAGFALMIGFLVGWSARSLLTLRQYDLAVTEHQHQPEDTPTGTPPAVPGSGSPTPDLNSDLLGQ